MKKYTLFILVAALSVLHSCSFLDVEPKVLVEDNTYKTERDVLYGLAGVYGAMNNEAFYGNYYSLMCSNTDDLCYFNRATTNSYVVMYRHDASSSEVYSVWSEIYAGIKNANNFMDAVKDSEFDKDGTFYNEARFMRAYYHFLLAQAFGDVPLRNVPIKEYDPSALMCAATPQEKVLEWAIEEMKACYPLATESFQDAPSRANKYTMQGILARAALFMAGESVKPVEKMTKKDYLKLALDMTDSIISSGHFRLNPDYSKIFINYITDTYDTEYRESMWEVDFLGDRSSAREWTNGRIGDLIGLQSNGSTDFREFNCNYSYGQYDGSPKLWELYSKVDRTTEETGNAGSKFDARQEWNLPPYNYAGSNSYPPYGTPKYEDASLNKCRKSIDRAPYTITGKSTTEDPNCAGGIRNAGKFRRETIYEGHKESKRLYTNINYPLLRYADVLLMYAEAYNEYHGAPTEDVFEKTILEVRGRAHVATKSFADYSSQDAFRQLVRNERGRELCFESLRKYDLIRWGIFVEAMNGYSAYAGNTAWSGNVKEGYAISIGRSVQPKHVVLPVPAIELGVNTLLKQNPLW